MTPYFTWRKRLRLIWAIARGRMWVDYVEHHGWGERIGLRTREDIEILGDAS